MFEGIKSGLLESKDSYRKLTERFKYYMIGTMEQWLYYRRFWLSF